MDDERFDGLIRALGSGTTRRGALGLLAGVAGLGLSGVAAKRRRRGGAGRAKPRRRGRAQAAAADKVAVCHYDADADAWMLINVSQSGWDNGHSKHKQDYLLEDGCCTDADCPTAPGVRCCAGQCVNILVDESNCGACGVVCTTDEPCIDELTPYPVCFPVTPFGTPLCGCSSAPPDPTQ